MRTPDDSPLHPELEARLERCRGVLEELTQAGMRLVGALDVDDPSLPIETAALAFSRLSRAVRLNILLDIRLEELARGGLAALAAERTPAETATEAAAPADDVERSEPAERAETRVRLDREAPDEALRLIRRPMPEVVAAICRGLRLSLEDTAAAQAPFAALTANDDGPNEPPTRRTAGVPPAAPPGRPSSLKARLLGGAARARALGP